MPRSDIHLRRKMPNSCTWVLEQPLQNRLLHLFIGRVVELVTESPDLNQGLQYRRSEVFRRLQYGLIV